MTENFYDYSTSDGNPTLSHAIAFTVLYAVAFVAHSILAGVTKQWWLYGTIVPFLILEALGWGGRCGDTRDSYIMQIATLVIGPTFLSAMIYVDLGVVGLQYSPSSSLLSPKAFGVVFIICDVLSILIQAAGGGLASSASNNFDPDLLMTGSNVMLAGIAVQFACIIFYSLFFIEFCVRYYRNLPVKSQREQPIAVDPESPKNQRKLALRLTMLGIMSFLIIWRGIYRLIELSDGWSGQVIKNQDAFDTNDGMPMVIAAWVSGILHIGLFTPETNTSLLSSGKKGAASDSADFKEEVA